MLDDTTTLTDKEALIVKLGVDHRLAHQVLFRHRHPQETPPFHYEIIDDLHGASTRVLELAFRGAAKSTIAEEALTIDALYQRFRNWIIVGESATRACERLAAIKHELEYNEWIEQLFGPMRGPTWNEDKIILANGVVIQAFGRGQSLRGTKHEDARPDGVLIDDIEDEESVSSPDNRDKTQRWLMRTLLPALAPNARVRMLANMLDPDCLAVRLAKSSNWLVRRYPWEYIDPQGHRQPTWPARFTLDYIDRTKDEYVHAGLLNEYMQEYMVQPIDPSARTFTSDMFRVEPVVRTWQATYAMYDPARTTKDTSSHTGKVVFSWMGTRLIVWEGDGQLWKPDQIIDDIFTTCDTYSPIKVGVEKDGLEEFLLQPLRNEQTRRHTLLPIVPMSAPVGKLSFIKSLQPFFMSKEVIFAKELPVLQSQLLSYPTGRIDVPNALAYALRMRPGMPLYDMFGFVNTQEDILTVRAAPLFLAVNATRQYTTGVLTQVINGSLHVLADWIMEGDPGLAFGDLLVAARLEAGRDPKVFAHPSHWGTYDTVGLRAAMARQLRDVRQGGTSLAGRDVLRQLITRQSKNLPCCLVSQKSRWVLNGLSGGYARSVTKSGEILDMADDGIYKVLIEGLESFAAVLGSPIALDDDTDVNYEYTGDGRRYISARASHR